MLERLVALSLQFRLLVVLAFVGVAALGVRAWQNVPLDAFPDVTPTQVTVYTEAPGVAGEDVERIVTFPIESALAGLPDVQQVRSVSLFGLSYITVTFRDRTSVWFARQVVAERLQEARERIPDGYGKPVLGPNSSGLGQVYWYALRSSDPAIDTTALRTLHDWTVRLLLRTAPGVDDVLSWGGHEKQFQVEIDPARLVRYGLALGDVLPVLAGANRQVGGQSLVLGSEQYAVRGIALVRHVDDLASTVLTERNGVPIAVRDIATVREGSGVRFGAVTQDGSEVVLGLALARIGEDAERVVEAVKARLDTVRKLLPAGVTLDAVYDRTELIAKAIAMADRAMLEGVALVIAVLFLFMGEVRGALVVVVAIPLARLIAFVCMERFGLSANLLSLGGLVIGLGMTVDGPIVVVENAVRLFAQPGATRETRVAVVLAAVSEVIRPVVFGVLVIALVFVPLLALEGLEGKLFRPLALNMVFAVGGSLVATVLLIPVLASLAMKPRAPHVPRIVGWATRVYTPVLDRALARPRSVVAIAGVAFVGALALFPWLGREFMPTLVEQEVMLRITGIASASLEESIATSHRVERVLARFAETRHATAVIGRSERGETADVNYMEVLVELKPPEEWPRAKTFPALSAEMREAVEAAVPGIVVASSQPIQMRVDELISGVRSPLALKLYGDDLDALERLAGQARELLQSISGATDVSVEANRGKPQLVIRVDREAAGRFGVRIDALMDVVQTGIGGRAVSQVLDGTRRFDLVVRLAEPARIDIEAIRALPIRGADGALVPLSRIAAVAPTEGYSFVRREQLERYAIVQLGVEGRDMDGFVREADAKLAQALKLPTGFRWDWGGAFENQRRAMARLAIILPITIGLIFVLLYTAFGAVRPALLILAGIPLAAIGGVAALAVSGQYLSVPAAVGFIAVFGVAVLNGLVLVKVYGHLRDSGRCARESAREGSLLRLRPVLMTALVEVLGLLPFLLATGVGSEILRPLATVVVGGLASATLLTLVVLPAAYVLMHGAEPAAGDTRRDPAAGGAGAPGPGAPDVGAA